MSKKTKKINTCLQQTDLWKAIEILQTLIDNGNNMIPCIYIENNSWTQLYVGHPNYSLEKALVHIFFGGGLCNLFEEINKNFKRKDSYFLSFKPVLNAFWFPRTDIQSRLDLCWKILEDMEAKDINPPQPVTKCNHLKN
jgi:hypothetical protein